MGSHHRRDATEYFALGQHRSSCSMFRVLNLLTVIVACTAVTQLMYQVDSGESEFMVTGEYAANNESMAYKRPNGKCKLGRGTKVEGCSCSGKLNLVYYIERTLWWHKLRGVMCVPGCSTSACIPPPVGKATCMGSQEWKSCVMPCYSLKDCPNGSYCTKDLIPPNICLYSP
ncbi:hypothetical protein FOL47_001120 [Perkinsus chesapeaki]|uniref:Uncharacterized protein n=1 Tax=Perkinsus chesapeaki TaxID=330153 RepID=A0A7J6MJX8_PERCH|nr:hypothetical protein FOL47_001120 [Perkinsus chesapeaki]